MTEAQQETETVTTETKMVEETDGGYLSLNLGTNVIDNSNGNALPFSADSWDFRTPFFLTLERKFNENWSLSTTLSTNKLKLESNENLESYYSADVMANLFVGQFLWDNKDLELFIGGGVGVHSMYDDFDGSVNFSAGMRYWVTDKIAINVRGIGKTNNNGFQEVGNLYQFNAGIALKLKKYKGRKEVIKTETVTTITEKIVVVEQAKPAEQKVSEIEESPQGYQGDTDLVSTDATNNPLERDEAKKNAAGLLNTDSKDATTPMVNTDYGLVGDSKELDVDPGFYVIIYAYKLQSNVDIMLELMKEKNINAMTVKSPSQTFTYISVARFNTEKEGQDYIKSGVDAVQYDGVWLYEVI